MGYTCRMQKPASYQNKKYGQGTIGSSGCGPAALVNALRNAGIADVSVPTMCKYAVSVGARVDGGTDMNTLIRKAASKYGFEYVKTSKNDDLMAHLRAGHTAILYNGNTHPWFTTGGHYTAALGLSNGKIVVADSLYYPNKWSVKVHGTKRSSEIKPYGKSYSSGLVVASIRVVGQSTVGKVPSYFLIKKKNAATKPTTKPTETITKPKTEEDDDMTYYKMLNDVPSWYKPTIEKLVKRGIINGTGNGELNISEDVCRTLTIIDKAGVFD